MTEKNTLFPTMCSITDKPSLCSGLSTQNFYSSNLHLGVESDNLIHTTKVQLNKLIDDGYQLLIMLAQNCDNKQNNQRINEFEIKLNEMRMVVKLLCNELPNTEILNNKLKQLNKLFGIISQYM